MHQPSFRGVVAALSGKLPRPGLGSAAFGARLLIAFALDQVPARAVVRIEKSRVFSITLSDQIDQKIALEPPPRVLTSQARRRMLHLFAARNLRRHE